MACTLSECLGVRISRKTSACTRKQTRVAMTDGVHRRCSTVIVSICPNCMRQRDDTSRNPPRHRSNPLRIRTPKQRRRANNILAQSDWPPNAARSPRLGTGSSRDRIVIEIEALKSKLVYSEATIRSLVSICVVYRRSAYYFFTHTSNQQQRRLNCSM